MRRGGLAGEERDFLADDALGLGERRRALAVLRVEIVHARRVVEQDDVEGVLLRAGQRARNRASRKPANNTSKIRSSNKMICSIMTRRRFRFCDLSRNSIAAQRTRRKRMRLIRWMMIGELINAVPAAIAQGFRKRSNIGLPVVLCSLSVVSCQLSVVLCQWFFVLCSWSVAG